MILMNYSKTETPAIPYNVLREALINAIVHRDYSHAVTSIVIDDAPRIGLDCTDLGKKL